MKDLAKQRLHKILNLIYYLLVIANFAFPVAIMTVSGIAISKSGNLHWSIKWTAMLTFFFAAFEFFSQIRRTLTSKNK